MMITYHIDLLKEENGEYFVKIRELRGCMSDGKNVKDALLNIADAMTGWITAYKNNEIPVPKSEEDKGIAIW